MKKDDVRYSFMVDRELLTRFKYIAAYNDRSMAKEFVRFIRRSIKDFESEHGAIPPEESQSREE